MTDRQTDMAKIIMVSDNYVKAPEAKYTTPSYIICKSMMDSDRTGPDRNGPDRTGPVTERS